jgi:hypothetical protein
MDIVFLKAIRFIGLGNLTTMRMSPMGTINPFHHDKYVMDNGWTMEMVI